MPPIIKQAILLQCMHAQSSQTLCNPTDSSVHGISQARILEWVAIPFSRGSSWPRDQTRVSCGSSIGRRILYSKPHTCCALKCSNESLPFPLKLQHLQLLSFIIFIHLTKKRIFWIADPWFSTLPMTLSSRPRNSLSPSQGNGGVLNCSKYVSHNIILLFISGSKYIYILLVLKLLIIINL